MCRKCSPRAYPGAYLETCQRGQLRVRKPGVPRPRPSRAPGRPQCLPQPPVRAPGTDERCEPFDSIGCQMWRRGEKWDGAVPRGFWLKKAPTAKLSGRRCSHDDGPAARPLTQWPWPPPPPPGSHCRCPRHGCRSGLAGRAVRRATRGAVPRSSWMAPLWAAETLELTAAPLDDWAVTGVRRLVFSWLKDSASQYLSACPSACDCPSAYWSPSASGCPAALTVRRLLTVLRLLGVPRLLNVPRLLSVGQLRLRECRLGTRLGHGYGSRWLCRVLGRPLWNSKLARYRTRRQFGDCCVSSDRDLRPQRDLVSTGVARSQRAIRAG